MKPATRKVLIFVALGVIIIGIVAWKASRALRPRVFDLAAATVTRLDVPNRTAEIEFVHPKSGRTMKVTGTVPPNCEIQIDGQPATLADVRVGDVGSVRAVSHGLEVDAQSVRIQRTPASTSAPATSPAGDS